MPIDGPVDHPGDRAGADAAESAAGRRGCGVREGSVFPRGAHRSGAAAPAAEGAGCEAGKARTKKPKKKKEKKKSAPPDAQTLLKLAELGLQALDRLRQKLHVRLLRLIFVSGAPDPYDTALAFGCVNAAARSAHAAG